MANWFGTADDQRNLIVVIGFCAIGLLISLAITAELPDFSAAMAQIDLVP